MTVSEVRKAISDGFSGFDMEGAQFLQCHANNALKVYDAQKLDGDDAIDLAGQGSLYLLQCPQCVSYILFET